MTKEMYEDLLERNRLQISELNTLTKEQDKHIVKLEKKNKELDGLLGVGTIFNKALNSMNKALVEERNKYRNMVFDQKDLLTKAKSIIEDLYKDLHHAFIHDEKLMHHKKMFEDLHKAEQFLQKLK